MKAPTLTLSLSKGERRPQAAKGEAGSSHVFNSLQARIAIVLVGDFHLFPLLAGKGPQQKLRQGPFGPALDPDRHG